MENFDTRRWMIYRDIERSTRNGLSGPTLAVGEEVEVVPASVADQLSKIIDEKIDTIGELVKENERLIRRQGALGSEDPAENPLD